MFKWWFQKEEVYIRIPNKGMDFVYSIKRGDKVIESAAVSPIDAPQAESSVGYDGHWSTLE